MAVAPVVAVVVKGSAEPSEGQGSPGCSMKVELLASWRWVTKEVVALGLITPTIP